MPFWAHLRENMGRLSNALSAGMTRYDTQHLGLRTAPHEDVSPGSSPQLIHAPESRMDGVNIF
jgi:hypothetical protein